MVSGGNCKCWEYDEEIRRGVRYVEPEEVDVCGLQEVRFKNEGVKFLQGG